MNGSPEELLRCIKEAQSLFHYFEENEYNDIPDYFSLRNLGAGETIWNEGGSCNYMIFIVSGHLEIKKETEFKGRQITLGIYGTGSIAGELCMLDQQPRAVTATAIEDVSLIVLSKSDFEQLLEDHPLLGIKLLKGMLSSTSMRLRKSFDRLVSIF
ncbi:MAG: cyclic nucleotide-binding domain-containing protein [Thiogranum sp.]|nr:cyclic nucleotide-binding domain-containing protein [Thiogranum sp.]